MGTYAHRTAANSSKAVVISASITGRAAQDAATGMELDSVQTLQQNNNSGAPSGRASVSN